MTREEAIHEIRQWDFINNDEMEALRTLIPELRESEDERVRKVIFKLLLGMREEIFTSQDEIVTKEKALSWLEKQKEPKPEFPKPHKGDDTNPYDMSVSEAQEYAINRGFGIPFNDGEVYVDERHMTQTIGNILRWADEHPKEQKPNIELIQRSWYMEGYHDRDFFMEPKWILKTGEGGPKHEPNPRYGKSLILGTEPCCCSVNVESEYDKGWRDGHKAGLKDAEMQKPAWKPSEEHLSALLAVFNDPNNIGSQTCQLALTDLYEQLKQL